MGEGNPNTEKTMHNGTEAIDITTIYIITYRKRMGYTSHRIQIKMNRTKKSHTQRHKHIDTDRRLLLI